MLKHTFIVIKSCYCLYTGKTKFTFSLTKFLALFWIYYIPVTLWQHIRIFDSFDKCFGRSCLWYSEWCRPAILFILFTYELVCHRSFPKWRIWQGRGLPQALTCGDGPKSHASITSVINWSYNIYCTTS